MTDAFERAVAVLYGLADERDDAAVQALLDYHEALRRLASWDGGADALIAGQQRAATARTAITDLDAVRMEQFIRYEVLVKRAGADALRDLGEPGA